MRTENFQFSYLENERKLDPLPEEKIMPTTTTTTPTTTASTPTTTITNPTNSHSHSRSSSYSRREPEPDKEKQQSGRYQRVYADWKPSQTLDHTDVVGNLEAIADATTTVQAAQPHLTTAEELRQYRRQRSQEQAQSTSPLQSIAEEDRRKSIIQKLGDSDGNADRLKIYVRRPSSMDLQPEPAKRVEPKSPTQDDTFASLLDHHKSHNESQYASASSKEIDADNIETPPVTRRVLATPNSTVVTVSMTDKPKHTPEEKSNANTTANEQDAPGHFDRYALARRTRRYKRPTDYSSGNEELIMPTQDLKQSASASEVRRLQKEETQPEKARTITKLEKVGRHISSINQEDVREAIRNLKSPTGTPERPWSPPRELTPNKLKLNASGHHELNDEGFEETQSLVSDTPSHGKGESTNSSCNEANDAPAQRSRPLSKQKTSTTSISAMGSRLADRLQQARRHGTSTNPSQSQSGNKSQNQIPATATITAPLPKRSLSASRPLRMPNGTHMPSATPTTIRSSSSTGVRRSPHEPPQFTPNYAKQRDVERSSSRNSLRSSRSSINSGASTQTVVRRLPSVQRTATVSVDSSPSKRPLAAQNARPTTSGRGVPASRSSSSGSSVGPSVILVRSKLTTGPRAGQAQPLGNSTSFKENQTAATATATASRLTAARSAMLVKNVLTQQAKSNSSNNNSQQQQPRNRSVSSFMRPTASSATKRQK